MRLPGDDGHQIDLKPQFDALTQWRERDLNPRLLDYEPSALPNCVIPLCLLRGGVLSGAHCGDMLGQLRRQLEPFTV
jgi:hypothetical protein